ncbi:ABC transporter permease [Sodaliphilus sp.]|uniref:ABC transporter permease n=1 Tax=Sodaliphilus sp. TaxID=2815818 RepID=UPI00388FC3A3
MNWTLTVAWRYLVSKKTHNAVNIISIISVLGVMVTTAALVCVLSVFNGFRGMIMGRLAMLDPEIAVTYTTGKAMPSGDSVVSAVSAVAGVASAMPVVEDQALAIFADYQMPVRLKGVPDTYAQLNDMHHLIVDGEFLLHDAVSPYAVLGVGPALSLHARPGYLRMMQLYAPQRQGRVNLANPMGSFRTDSVFVSGVFQLQQNNYDADLIYVPLDMARKLFDYPTEATQIEVKLAPGADEESVMRSIKDTLGESYTVKNRLMQQAMAYKMINVEKWMGFLLLAFILVIATFNVISTLTLLIIEKDRSIATFLSMGASGSQVTRIFVTEGWLISLVGAVSGIVLGLVLCLCQQQFGWLTLNADPASLVVNAYPVEVIWSDIIIVFLLVAAVGLFTSLVTSLTMRRRLATR